MLQHNGRTTCNACNEEAMKITKIFITYSMWHTVQYLDSTNRTISSSFSMLEVLLLDMSAVVVLDFPFSVSYY